MGRHSERSKLRAQIKQEEQEQYEIVLKAQLKDNPIDEFPAFLKFNRNGINVQLDHKKVGDLEAGALQWILDLEKRNMENVYNTCAWGWKEKKKTDEMTEPKARYLLAYVDSKPVAFAHYRFDMDYGDAVLYCYELQLEECVRRKGLGKFLLQLLELIAFKNNMRKVILTVLKHNKAAVDFFYSLKYSRDDTNPVENLYEDIPYEILSKMNKKLIKP